MKAICPNLRNKEVKQLFDELKNTLGEEVAYYVWSYNNGYSLDYAPNGALSKLFSDLLKLNKGDRKSAIMAKARAYSPSYRKLHVDWLLQSNDEEIYESLDSNSEPFIEDLLKEGCGFQLLSRASLHQRIQYRCQLPDHVPDALP